MNQKHIVWVSIIIGYCIVAAQETSSPVWKFVADKTIRAVNPVNIAGKGVCETAVVVSSGTIVSLVKIAGPSAGKPIWNSIMPGPVSLLSIIVCGKTDVIAAGCQTGGLYFVAPKTGKIVMLFAIIGAPRQIQTVTNTKSGGRQIIVSSDDGFVYGFAEPVFVEPYASQNPLWRYRVSGDSTGDFTANHLADTTRKSACMLQLIGAGKDAGSAALAVSTSPSSLHCLRVPLDTTDRLRELWSISTGDSILAFSRVPDADSDGVDDVLVSILPDTLSLYAGKDGQRLWSLHVCNAITNMALRKAQNDWESTIIGAVDEGGKLYCLGARQESRGFDVRWIFDVRDTNSLSALTGWPGSDGGFVVGSTANKVYLLSGGGKKLWEAQTGGTVTDIQVLTTANGDNRPAIFVTDDGGTLVMFHPGVESTLIVK